MWNEGYFTEDTYTYGYYRDISPFYQQYCLLTHGYDVRITDENTCHCELGYGQGVSVNIHAAAVPGHWVGTDFNPAHTSHANLLCEAAQTDAQLWECSFAEMLERKNMPMFDSISLHGIWSWISQENQAHVVEFIRRYLKPGGIVYNSYNCFPGWAANHPVRELLLLQDKYIRVDSGSADRVKDAMQFADNVLKANPAYAERNPNLVKWINGLRDKDAHYVAQEYLNRFWTVMYFTEVAEIMQEAKLDYACTTELLDALDGADDLNFTNETKDFLMNIRHPLVREEVRDYYINRQFRKDLYIKGARKLHPREQVRRILGTRYVLQKTGPEALKCAGYNKTLAIKEEWTRAVVEYLAADNNSPKDDNSSISTYDVVDRVSQHYLNKIRNGSIYNNMQQTPQINYGSNNLFNVFANAKQAQGGGVLKDMFRRQYIRTNRREKYFADKQNRAGGNILQTGYIGNRRSNTLYNGYQPQGVNNNNPVYSQYFGSNLNQNVF